MNANLITIDHIEIGKVLALGDRTFHASLNGGPRWLLNECIYTVEPKQVTLICSEQGLARYYAL